MHGTGVRHKTDSRGFVFVLLGGALACFAWSCPCSLEDACAWTCTCTCLEVQVCLQACFQGRMCVRKHLHVLTKSASASMLAPYCDRGVEEEGEQEGAERGRAQCKGSKRGETKREKARSRGCEGAARGLRGGCERLRGGGGVAEGGKLNCRVPVMITEREFTEEDTLEYPTLGCPDADGLENALVHE